MLGELYLYDGAKHIPYRRPQKRNETKLPEQRTRHTHIFLSQSLDLPMYSTLYVLYLPYMTRFPLPLATLLATYLCISSLTLLPPPPPPSDVARQQPGRAAAAAAAQIPEGSGLDFCSSCSSCCSPPSAAPALLVPARRSVSLARCSRL